ncbi:MAG: hypothetical protein R3A11_04360 [Bdellovibrionota bacterium]
MRAKVKIINRETGEEFLFLVSKMNLKGLLVSTSQTIKPKTSVDLFLMLGSEFGNVSLKGMVHKISKDGHRRGIVVAFNNPSKEVVSAIKNFVEVAKIGSGKKKSSSSSAETEKRKRPPSTPSESRKTSAPAPQEKTMIREEAPIMGKRKKAPVEDPEPDSTQIVDDDSLPTLSLQSPDNTGEINLHTMDEELVQAQHEGLSGHTTHFKMDEDDFRTQSNIRTKKKSSPFFKAAVFVVFLVTGVAGAKYVLDFLGVKVDLSKLRSKTSSSSSSVSTSSQSSETQSNWIEDILIDDQGSFVKVAIVGEGRFTDNEIEKIMDQGDAVLKISLPSITSFDTEPSIFVENEPIKKIEIKTDKDFVEIYVRFMKGFPRFEIKPYKSGLDAFFHRE